MNSTEHAKVQEGVAYLKSICRDLYKPKVGVVCGSGLGGLADHLDDKICIPYSDIPYFPKSTVSGHAGHLVFGRSNGQDVVCMKGRAHLYEGYQVSECVRPIRVMAMMGIKILIVTNAAGNLTKSFKPGDIMIIYDHISMPGLCGENPLRGSYDERFGKRFLPMTGAYNKELIELLLATSKELKMTEYTKKGVYAMVSGPTYETVAEARLLIMLGANTVGESPNQFMFISYAGMSTVHEVIAAHQMGVKCVGISLITNNCASNYNDDDCAVHDQVLEMANEKSADLVNLVLNFIRKTNSVCLTNGHAI